MDATFALLSLDSQRLLRRGGFSKLSEALRLPATDLAKELQVDLARSLALQQEVRAITTNNNTPSPPTALELVQQLSSATPNTPAAASSSQSMVRNITTCCMTLDKLLGGGAPRGSLTELCGAPGAGKTQVCMQLAVACSIPEQLGGVEGRTLYLDTEGSFSPQRVHDMAQATCRHLDSLGGGGGTSLTVERAMTNIQVVRAHDVGELLAFVHSLAGVLRQQQDGVRMVVIDSVAHHFRHDFADYNHKNRVLARVASTLNSVAQEFDVAVVVTNHMTTSRQGGDELLQHLLPALGDTWFHGVTNRLVLRKTGESVLWEPNQPVSGAAVLAPLLVPVRTCELVKSSSLASGVEEFIVVRIGIRQRPRVSSAAFMPVSSSSVMMSGGGDNKRARV